MKISRIIILTAVIATTMFNSCNYLRIDNYFGDELALDSIFAEKRYVEAYLWGAVGLFSDEGRILYDGDTPGPLATDEAISADPNYIGMRYVLGMVSAAVPWGNLNKWGPMYRIIRKCNTVLQRSSEARDMTPTERMLLNSYARFFRAYAYYNLLSDFGPPILLGDEIVDNNATLESYDRPRSTYDEAVEYICSELEAAGEYLPPNQPLMDVGLPTKGAAYGLIARIRLTHASPLFNGGAPARACFGTWTRKTDGANYVSQQYDERRWAVAAAAAKRVMDMGQYSLYTVTLLPNSITPPKPMPAGIVSDPDYYKTWPEGAAGIDHFLSYSDMFTGEAVFQLNREMVWARSSDAMQAGNQRSFPVSNNGWNSLSITQKVIDAYSMFDGQPITASSVDYPYSETGFTTAIENFSGYRLNANVYKMYANREMRFYASIGFQNRYWPMTSCTNTTPHDISYFKSGANGKSASSDRYPLTGYVLTKYAHRIDAFLSPGQRRMSKSFGIIRYAEILLSYAEALNNLTTSHTVETNGAAYTYTRDAEAIRVNFGQVRHRAGLPAPSAAELANATTMQQLIEKERMVEFVCENRRYYDVRRWGKYEETENETITGMNTDGDDDNYFHRTVPNSSHITGRVVNRKMIFMPIPLDEVRRLPSLDQNPGWEK